MVTFKACEWNKVAILLFFCNAFKHHSILRKKGINIWKRRFHVPNRFTSICLHPTGPLYSQSSVKLLSNNSEDSNLHPAFNFKRLLSFIFRHQQSSHQLSLSWTFIRLVYDFARLAVVIQNIWIYMVTILLEGPFIKWSAFIRKQISFATILICCKQAARKSCVKENYHEHESPQSDWIKGIVPFFYRGDTVYKLLL